MDPVNVSINLLKTQPRLSPEFVALETNLRRASVLAFLVLTVVGIGIGVSFLFLQQRSSEFETQKLRLGQSIAAQERKESSVVVVKQRLSIAEKVLAASKSWGPAMETVASIAPGLEFTSIASDDQNRLTVIGKTTSVDRVLTVAKALSTAVEGKTIRSPQLESLQLNADGAIQIKISFVPIL